MVESMGFELRIHVFKHLHLFNRGVTVNVLSVPHYSVSWLLLVLRSHLSLLFKGDHSLPLPPLCLYHSLRSAFCLSIL